MDNQEAIETLKANYPDACYEQLREAVDMAISVLRAQDLQQTCNKLATNTISRQAAIDIAKDLLIQMEEYHQYNQAVNNYCAELVKLPPVQPEIIRCKDCKYRTSLLSANDAFCGNRETEQR